jgi:hypothetical protein
VARGKKIFKSPVSDTPALEEIQAVVDVDAEALPADLVDLTVASVSAEETEEVEAEAEVEEAEVEEADEEQIEAKRADDEPASFLGMYFRDMAELDVLRPEQEFETARKIEEQELELWRTILGFAPGASWIADAIEAAAGETLPDIATYRLAAEHSRKKVVHPRASAVRKGDPASLGEAADRRHR